MNDFDFSARFPFLIVAGNSRARGSIFQAHRTNSTRVGVASIVARNFAQVTLVFPALCERRRRRRRLVKMQDMIVNKEEREDADGDERMFVLLEAKKANA